MDPVSIRVGLPIAFLRLDQARVPEYPIVDFLVTNGRHEPQWW